MSNQKTRQQIVAVGKRIYSLGLISGGEGNISVRLADQQILATPSGLCKGDLTESDLVTIDTTGNHVAGDRRVSSEIAMHLEVYRQRPDIQAVVHAHPPMCIGLMLAGHGLDRPILAESVILLGKVPIAGYARPSTQQVPESIRELVNLTDCILLDHHGSLTMGNNLDSALHKLESMEHAAKSYLAALNLGPVRELPEDEIRELMLLRTSRYKIPGKIIPFV